MSCDTAGFSAGSGGANQTWNFTSLNVVDSLIYAIVHRNSASNGGQFPNASFVEVFGTNEVYVENNASQYAVGGLSQSGIIIKYPNTQINYNRPATYQDTLVDTFTTEYTVMSFNVKGAGVIRTKVDGYGTLVLPDSTYSNVLRFKIESDEVDTIQGLPAPANLVLVKARGYIWFDAKHKGALMRVDSIDIKSPVQNTTVYTVSYYKAGQALGVQSISSFTEDAACYIGTGVIKINAPFNSDKEYHLSVYNSSGQVVFSDKFKATGNLYTNTISDLPNGLYYMSLSADNQQISAIKVYKR